MRWVFAAEPSSTRRTSKRWAFTGQALKNRGQMVVEYVLLLIVSIAVATLMVQLIVSRDADSPGFVIQKWRQLIEFVAQDKADDLNN